MFTRSGSESPREPDYTQERYINAQAAIDTVQELAEKDIVYDQWPIDDPHRHAALCVVAGMQSVDLAHGDGDLNSALINLPSQAKKKLIYFVSFVIELRHNDLCSHHDNVYESIQTVDSRKIVSDSDYGDECVLHLRNGNELRMPPDPIPCDYVRVVRDGREVAYWNKEEWREDPDVVMGALMGAAASEEMPLFGQTVTEAEPDPNAIPKLQESEQRRLIAESAHRIADHWANHHSVDLGVTERVMGAVHGVLSLFQNGMPEIVPPMQLVPIDPQTDNGCITELMRGGKLLELDWNYGKPMGLTYDPGPMGGDPNSPPGSLTYSFETHYEIMRGRYRTAASDLFNIGDN
jgi:hypothetical protein